ncbi:hypothetical protein L7F22_014215 [Adiantum nelumboides]|nr:hypothetical protein [Adiantum nelumboides]
MSTATEDQVTTMSRSVRGDDWLSTFEEKTDVKLPTLPSIPRESHLVGTSNYRIWKARMLSVLDSYDLQDFVLERISKPDEEDHTRHYIWTRVNGKVRSFIINNCKDVILSSVLTITNAKDMWDKLAASHDRVTPMKRVSWDVQLRLLDPAQSGSMREHITKMEQLRDRIRQAEGNLTDEDMAITLLSQLPASYSMFYTSLITSGRLTIITWDELVPQVLDQEDRNVSGQAGGLLGWAASVTTEALAVSTSPKPPPRAGPSNPRPSAPPNAARGTPRPQPASSQQRSQTERDALRAQRTCNNCGERGHYWRKCPRRQRTSGSPIVAATANPHSSPTLAFVGEIVAPTAVHVGDSILSDREWIIDSGAVRHMTPSFLDLTDFTPRDRAVSMGDKSQIPILGEGIMHLIPDGKGGKQVIFDEDSVSIRDKETGQEVRGGFSSGGLYKIHALSAITGDVGVLWHYRYGHLHADAFQRAFTQQLVDGMPDVRHPDGRCVPCIRGKQHREAFPKKASRRAAQALELVHTDLCGPMSVDSLGGSKYFMLIVDDYSRFTWVYFLTHKSEAISTFICWKAHVEKESGNQVKPVRSDHGLEFTSHQFVDYCASFGIRRELSNVGTPSENGVVERKNRTVVEMGQTLLEHRDLPRFLWAESVATAVHILNRAPTFAVPHSTPYEAYYGKKPSIAHLCVFGCDAYAHIPKKDRSKFDAKSRKLLHVGYNSVSASYRLYDSASRKIEHCRDVISDESSVLEGAPGLPVEGDSPHVSLIPDDSPDHPTVFDVVSSDGITVPALRQLRSSPTPVPNVSTSTEKDALGDEDNGPDELSSLDPGFHSNYLQEEEELADQLKRYP